MTMMTKRRGAIAGVLALAAAACGGSRPAKPAPVTGAPPVEGVRYLAGGDSRNDASHVVAWAFAEAKARGASGFFFLGDMEITPELDRSFRDELRMLDPVPFFPALGNHEIHQFGFLPIGVAGAEKAFQEHFLGTARTPVKSVLPGRVVYSTDLPGGVHFVALDNVTRAGFGPEQLAWLSDDLARASGDPLTRHIIVGMHKPLARNGVSPHGMEHDGAQAAADSDAALALFQKHRVSLVLQSHVHQFAKIDFGGIPAYITGGLGAPLDRVGPERAFHHFLQIDVTADALSVSVVKFRGSQTVAEEGEPEND
jgi:hypothetical protein